MREVLEVREVREVRGVREVVGMSYSVVSRWLVLGSLIGALVILLDSPWSRPWNCAGRLTCSQRSSLGWTMS